MNAKEIADKLRTSQQIARLASIHEMADVFESIAEQVELLVPRYRPPQPSDDGKWCYVEQLPDFKGPHQIFANSTGEYWFDDVTAGEIKIVTKGVWPCERPEGGGA